MYKRLNIWDEDKWDIHSTGAGGSSSGYAGHSSKDSQEDYHKHEIYNSSKDEDKNKEVYQSVKKDVEEKEKKENEEKEKTIVDAVEQEEKYQKKEEQEEGFHAVAKGIQQSSIGNEDAINKNNKKEIEKKNIKNIEEAINEAIKEEKEIVHVD